MNLIASADGNWGIGLKNRLLAHIPEDMAFFRDMTMGNVVVMGRKTLESLPGGRPLKGRENLVLTHNKGYQAEGARIVHGIGELRQSLAQYGSHSVYVIGGEAIYRQLLGWCDTAYITRICRTYQADAFLPDLDKMEGWELAAESGEKRYSGLKYRFLKYEKKAMGRDDVAMPQRAADR